MTEVASQTTLPRQFASPSTSTSEGEENSTQITSEKIYENENFDDQKQEEMKKEIERAFEARKQSLIKVWNFKCHC